MENVGLFLLTTVGPIALAALFGGIWLVAHLSAAPGERVEALWGMVKYHKRGSGPTNKPSHHVDASTQGVGAGGAWLQVSTVDDAKYICRLLLSQQGDTITGKASVTRTGVSDGYVQNFRVVGSAFAGYVALTFRSSDPSSLSIASALLQSTDRGRSLVGQWLYRSGRGNSIRAEELKLARQGGPNSSFSE